MNMKQNLVGRSVSLLALAHSTPELRFSKPLVTAGREQVSLCGGSSVADRYRCMAVGVWRSRLTKRGTKETVTPGFDEQY